VQLTCQHCRAELGIGEPALGDVLGGLGERRGQQGFHVVEPALCHRLGQLDHCGLCGLHARLAEVRCRHLDGVRVGHKQPHLGRVRRPGDGPAPEQGFEHGGRQDDDLRRGVRCRLEVRRSADVPEEKLPGRDGVLAAFGRAADGPRASLHDPHPYLVLDAAELPCRLYGRFAVDIGDRHVVHPGGAGPNAVVPGRGPAEGRQREAIAGLRFPRVPERIEVWPRGARDRGVQEERAAQPVGPRSSAVHRRTISLTFVASAPSYGADVLPQWRCGPSVSWSRLPTLGAEAMPDRSAT
jgi:hypothetical protein